MKSALFCAAASAVFALSATSVSAADHESGCHNDRCGAYALFAAPAESGTAAVRKTAARLGGWGYDAAGRDPSVRPGDDFYMHANGAWQAKTEIPADRSRYGMFHALGDLSEQQVDAILKEAAADRAASGERAKLGTLYAAFLDEAAVERLGARPLTADLAEVRAATTREQLAALMGAANKGFGESLFGMYVSDDSKAPERYAVYVQQGGLGLPDRDYYLDPKFKEPLAKYQAYVAQMLALAGWPQPQARAAEIVAFETEVAKASWTRAESRDRDRTYNPMTPADLESKAPGFPWRAFLNAADLSGVDKLVVSQSTAVPRLAAIFASTSIETLQAWQAFHTADSAAPYLSKAFVDARFEFRNKTLQGQPEQRARWKRAVAYANGAMGEAVGKIYVERHFPADSKVKMDRLVSDLKTAMRGRLQRLDWMSPETKTRALDKLAKFKVKIGYPTKWRDYAALDVRPGDVYGNQARATAFEWAHDVGRLNEPVDDAEWLMTPQTVNAYYMPPKNEIVFPAAILQPPFFDPNADPAVNYGGIGSVIGHEITHGFDDQGRKSDGEGVLRDWWTAEDAAKFKVQADRLGAQYASYEPVPGSKVNPALTMGENIADLGGLLMALDAYKLSLGGKPAPVIDGLTGEQRLFLGFAQVWRTRAREEALREMVVSDPHSPETFRANGPVRNVDAWYSAFEVKPGQQLHLPPEQRVRIW
jgi:putative endopeptidase